MGECKEESDRKIELITGVSELSGTLFFEFQKGKHDGTHWKKDSVYIFEEFICFIEQSFQKNINNYSHYSFSDVNKSDWQVITEELKDLTKKIKASKNFDDISRHLKFYFKHDYHRFELNFEINKNDLAQMLNDFISWINKTLKDYNHISILGI